MTKVLLYRVWQFLLDPSPRNRHLLLSVVRLQRLRRNS